MFVELDAGDALCPGFFSLESDKAVEAADIQDILILEVD
jgi:hypothetical protein